MAVVTARALEVAFRHLDVPVRWWEGPGSIETDGAAFTRAPLIELSDAAAPSWSITEPTGFAFSYRMSEAELTEFFKHSTSNVQVKLYRFFRDSAERWHEQVQWRFEGEIGSATWDASDLVVGCNVVPISLDLRLRPHVRPWSRRSREDTGFRWMRSKRPIETLTPEKV